MIIHTFFVQVKSLECHAEGGGDGGDDSDVPLPTAVGPTKKKQRRLIKVRDVVTTHWRQSDRTHNIKPDVLFAGYKEGTEAVKVGASHDLPVRASEYDFFLSFVA